MTRISDKQRRILNLVAIACIPQEVEIDKPKRVVPLYTGHLPDVFDSDAQEKRFLENLEQRGLLRIDKEHFLYITAQGLEAIGREPGEQVPADLVEADCEEAPKEPPAAAVPEQQTALDVLDDFERAHNGFYLDAEDYEQWFRRLRTAIQADADRAAPAP